MTDLTEPTVPTYPPADDRLKHLLAQEINLSVDTWKLAFWIADGIVKCPEIRAELDRIADAHTAGTPCGDRHCEDCRSAAAHPRRSDPYADGICPFGEGEASGSGCIKPAGHDGAHYVTPGDIDDEELAR